MLLNLFTRVIFITYFEAALLTRFITKIQSINSTI